MKEESKRSAYRRFSSSAEVISVRQDKSGYDSLVPSGRITSTGSIVNGLAQYSLNMHTTMLSTIFAFVRSVAVHSMKIFFVSTEIFEASPNFVCVLFRPIYV